MRAIFACLVGLVGVVAPLAVRGDEPPRFELKDGDRVVLVGDTLVERDQRYGYLETMLTLLNPEKDLTFRNLGWSGDTVAGLSRAGFDPPEAGYKQLVAAGAGGEADGADRRLRDGRLVRWRGRAGRGSSRD